MKVHTTNFKNCFIVVAEDCPAEKGQEPPVRDAKRSVANLQYDLLRQHPYRYTSDDIQFMVHVLRRDLPEAEWPLERERFFSKGQPCFRASPLTKRYGWGIHNDAEGKVALYGVETDAYQRFASGNTVEVVKAMRSKRI
ncbi:DUF6157 family protein [Pontibacter chitinilyticus]|uniref:DUF6157 family protein n=1 Tax=Pontibacter chitinilyticus TaxID=2674989 RepID=UPI00321B1231